MGHLISVPPEALLSTWTDKLYNARAILQDPRHLGDSVFDRFMADRKATRRYYRSLADAFSDSRLESWLVDKLGQTVTQLERAARGPAR